MKQEKPKKRILHSLTNDILERIGYEQTALLLVRLKRRIDEGMSVEDINKALLPQDEWEKTPLVRLTTYDLETEGLLSAMRDHYERLCKDCEGARQGCLTAKSLTAFGNCLTFGLHNDESWLS